MNTPPEGTRWPRQTHWRLLKTTNRRWMDIRYYSPVMSCSFLSLLILHSNLQGTHSIIQADHKALKQTLNLEYATCKLVPWWLPLSEMEFEVFHRAATEHQAADALSRLSTIKEDRTPIKDGQLVMSVVCLITKSDRKVGTRTADVIDDYDNNG